MKVLSRTVEEWFDEWLEDYKRTIVKSGTIAAYRHAYHAHVSDAMGDIPVDGVTGNIIQALLKGMSDSGLKDATINLTHALLSGMFGTAYKIGIIIKNPMDFVMRPHGRPKGERYVFTKDEQRVFIKYARESPLADFYLLALYTGMRSGELCGLMWEDADMQGRVIHVRRQLKSDGTLDTPKTRSSIRDIPMLPQTYDLLVKRERICDFVLEHGGQPLKRHQISQGINWIIRRMRDDGVELGHFSAHCLRHVFATRAIEAGMPPQVLKSIMGHSSLSVTMDLYAHVLLDSKREAMERIVSAFS